MAVFIPLIGDFIIAKVNTEEGNGVLNDTFQNVNNPSITGNPFTIFFVNAQLVYPAQIHFHKLPLTLTSNLVHKKTFPQVYKVAQVKTEK